MKQKNLKRMRRSLAFVGATLSVWLMIVMVIYHLGVGQHLHPHEGEAWAVVGKNNTVSGSHRKLLQEDDPFMNRVGPGRRKCSESDIQVNQGQTLPLPNGIPTYTVVVTNTCPTGCEIAGIHLSCGWFSSARLINPNIFKRIGYDDCLVNGGNPLPSGGALSFQYANTFSYPLSVSSVACLS